MLNSLKSQVLLVVFVVLRGERFARQSRELARLPGHFCPGSRANAGVLAC